MKFFAPFLFLFLNSCIAQTKNELKDYSYLILHKKNGDVIGNSTGFFIRDNDKLFFITNYHVCTCVDVFKKEIFPVEWDTLWLRLFDDRKRTIYKPLLMTYKTNRKIDYFFNYLDICIYEIKHLAEDIHVNSLEQYIDTSNYGEPIETEFWGYHQNTVNTNLNADTFQAISHLGKLQYPVDLPITIDEFEIIDYSTLIINPSTNSGASGSPIFFKYKSVGIKLGGIIFGTSQEYNQTYLVKASYLVRCLKEFQNLK